MTDDQGEGVGHFRIAIDPQAKPIYDALPAAVRQALKVRLERAAIDPSATKAVLAEGQYFIDGTALEDGKFYYYNARFAYDVKNHVLVLANISPAKQIPGLN